MDVDEKATELEMLAREDALERQRRAAAKAPNHKPGICANCGEILPPEDRSHFCDADCRSDYDRRSAAKQRNGSC